MVTWLPSGPLLTATNKAPIYWLDLVHVLITLFCGTGVPRVGHQVEYSMSDLNSIDELVLAAPQINVNVSGARQSWVGVRRDAVSRHSGLAMRLPRNGAPLIEDSLRRQRNMLAKRAFDVVTSGLAVLFLLPMFLIVAALIKISSRGPVFFAQEREGYLGRPFYALKFRSMRIEDCDATGVAQTVRDDPRVTPIGRFIRRTSIDELPQLINVLKGDMALVGPRPHVSDMRAGGTSYKALVPYYDLRLQMLPGLTGWAQANGLRGPTDRADLARARIDHDIAYIQNFSFWLDIKIIILTLRHEFVGGSGH
jgi:lipopolysaccharide/colanic/teichoic acid biosynthesis glycosyltransferase